MSAFDGTNGPQLKLQFLKSGTWTNVTTTDVRSIKTKRGRTRPDQQNDPAQAIIVLDNRSGIYDPDYTSASTWVVSGTSILKAGLQMRIIWTWSSVDYTWFVGKLETTDLDIGFDATATMTFVDFSADFANIQAPALAVPAFQETTATRVGRMLTYAGFTGSSSLTGTVQLTATSQDAPVLQMIEECVNAEAGRFYMSRDGVATFVPLSNKFSRVTRLLLSDSRATNTVEYDSIKTTPGTYQVINQAVINRPSKTQYTAKYTPSVTAYGLKSKTYNAPVNTDSVASNLAAYYARVWATPATLVEQIGFDALALSALYPDFLALEIGDQITVERTTVDGRALTYYLVVEGFTNTITSDRWRTEIQTSTMNPYTITL